MTIASRRSAWSAFHSRVFLALWIAAVTSNIGTAMFNVGAAWLMTSLNPSPLMVSLVQAATTLPIFVFALPAGVLSDIIDRRRFLLFTQAWTIATAVGIALFAFQGLISPSILLGATCLLGIGAALSAPPFQAVVAELVPHEDLASAVAMNAIGVSVSRAIGPALGGVLVATTGPKLVFALNAVSALGVLLVLWRWKRSPAPNPLPPEGFLPAMRVGLRYVAAAPAFRTILVRAVAFFVFASAAWSLLPLVARTGLDRGPDAYGILLAALGVGALAGAIALPRLRGTISADWLTVSATWVFAAATLGLALMHNFPALVAVMLAAGSAWVTLLSTFNVGAQRASAGWVKARALSVYILAFFGAMTAGSALWGQVATMFGVSTALLLAGTGMVMASAVALRWRLDAAPDLDLRPSEHWVAPDAAILATDGDQGPVLVMIEYQVASEHAAAFRYAVHELRDVRRRIGALTWGIYEDTERPGRYVETFVAESWLEHIRQHGRVSKHDQSIQDRVHAYLGSRPPIVSRLIAANILANGNAGRGMSVLVDN